MQIPMLTKHKEKMLFNENISSCRIIADSNVPNTGIVNPKTVTFPTELYFNSTVHILNAAAEIKARYINRNEDFNVNPFTSPPVRKPISIRTAPPKRS